MSPAELVAAYLIQEGVAQWVGSIDTAPGGALGAPNEWRIGVGPTWPSVPDTVLLVNEAGGLAPMPQWLVDFPTVQIVGRGNQNGQRVMRQKLEDARDELLGMTPGFAVAGNGVIQSARQLGGFLPLGRDDNERPMMSVNFSLIALPEASARTNRAPIT
jgi:hypothetical protein